MSRLRRTTTLLAVATVGCAPGSVSEPARPELQALLTVDGVGAQVTGHASVTQAPGVLRTFSFSARQMPDGTVEGNFVNHNRLGDAVNHGEIDCLRLIPPNGAVLSGPIRKHTNPDFEGGTTVFRVEDNGEGGDSPPDRVSQLLNFLPGVTADCHAVTPLILLPVEGGNIQVRP
jgi:hypothetical protein